MFRMGKKPEAESEPPHNVAATPAYTPSYNAPRPEAPPAAQRTGMPAMSPELRRDAPTPGRAFTESEAVARDIKDGNLSGFVGGGTALTGEVTFKAMLRIDGHLTGRITSDSGTLVIGTTGQVDANIEVATAVIHGAVNGDIVVSQRLEMGRAARVFGNVQTPKLVIEEGAIFEGNCLMVAAKDALEKKNAPPPLPKPEVKAEAAKPAAPALPVNPVVTAPIAATGKEA